MLQPSFICGVSMIAYAGIPVLRLHARIVNCIEEARLVLMWEGPGQ